MKYIWDLDGVFRDLVTPIERDYKFKVKSWNFEINGMNMFDILGKDPWRLEKALPTDYLEVAKRYLKNITIWTSQPDDWRIPTINWLDKHIGHYKVAFFDSWKEKYNEFRRLKNTILVEDCPQFPEYYDIFLIDRPYNNKVKDSIRVDSPKMLGLLIKED